ncbi:MAG: 4a-hydroxytetrahydrobiopterin dehydratase [Candidatus Thermoplasmatota archaeon]|nr:4a-hydroxytetrahydrobiopterin dehydratase [Candidatus Thermoplasmatota archaeon]MEC9350826.1 4a-hydroxytetrahydrobiopterin dehydratase [Candidatus Thermoplasmatota archaeon]MEC9478123.1 4a-hydroxytetrahydrobiopterin dehydratase [Candidatus Thermoplasmatota archaeon]MED6312409.1 4a-hydroxytetrahydrobiopterin dehydratase [Candidatus Thermoplasmatota archaeon]
MSDLARKECIPCKGGVPPMGVEEAEAMLVQVNSDWKLIDEHHLERVWSFDNFESALEFVNTAGAICEEQGHHADFELGWGRVKAMIWTHKINGLTESDFVLAAKFDEI